MDGHGTFNGGIVVCWKETDNGRRSKKGQRKEVDRLKIGRQGGIKRVVRVRWEQRPGGGNTGGGYALTGW
jgi:hypothetical protein